jgi:pyruvate dehydrogenase E2 component (dihydrolipoamide acetyltransferase)
MSTLHALTVPKWGMSMEEGEISQWRVAVGDKLAVGDEVVDIETSKITNAAESPVAGTLVRIVGEVGQTLKVGMLLGVVATGAASDKDIDAFVASFVPDAAGAARAQSSATQAPVAPAVQAQPTVQQIVVQQTAAAAPAPAAAGALSHGPDDSTVNASAVARRIAKAHNINLTGVFPNTMWSRQVVFVFWLRRWRVLLPRLMRRSVPLQTIRILPPPRWPGVWRVP